MTTHKWTFKSRFRTNAYGWKGTALATKRLRDAVSEIKKVAKNDPLAAAAGAISLMERIWPSLQGIDGSPGTLGNAVSRTLDALIPLVVEAPADTKTRRKWLERLFEAVQEDGVDYLAPVEDRWGEICGDTELAHEWANRLLPTLKEYLAKGERVYWIQGESLCHSCLLATGRFDDLEQLLSSRSYRFWPLDKYWAYALVQQGHVDEAIEFAESCRKNQSNYDDSAIVAFCEQTLIDAGRKNEAYHTYAMQSSEASTHLATFRQFARRYPERDVNDILHDLIEARPPRGKWFAAARHADCLDVALECAADRSAEPATLIRAARDHVETHPSFAAEVARFAIKNLLNGGGYEPTSLDLIRAHQYLVGASAACGRSEWAEAETERLIAGGAAIGREHFLELLIAEHAQVGA